MCVSVHTSGKRKEKWEREEGKREWEGRGEERWRCGRWRGGGIKRGQYMYIQ